MDTLKTRTCEPCRKGAPTVTAAEIAELHPQVAEWNIVEPDGIPRLERVFTFPDFASALEFTNRIGAIAEDEGHHPALLTEWGRVTVGWWTHEIRGLHRNDFIMAAKTDEAFSSGEAPVMMRREARIAILVLAAMMGGCGRAPEPDVRPMPEPPPPAPLENIPRLRVCVVRDGGLADVVTDYNPVTGDTLVDGRPFGEAFPTEPPAYARSASWMILNEPIVFVGRRYIRYGLPREIRIDLLELAGEYEGTPLFIEAGTGDRIVLYIPFGTGCVFQPYQTDIHGGAVRG